MRTDLGENGSIMLRRSKMHIHTKTFIQRGSYKTLGTLMLITLSLVSGQLLAEQTSQSSSAPGASLQQDVTHHLGWVDPYIANKVERNSQALIDVLERADQALVANDGDAVLARNNLDYAARIADGIEQEMPYVAIKDNLINAKGRIVAGATHDFFQQLVPVYTAIDNLALVSPQMAGNFRQGVEQAESLAKSGNGQAAMKQVDDVVDQLTLSRIYLPILFVKEQITTAQKLLAQKDMVSARQNVERALGSVIAVSTGDVVTGSVVTDATGPDAS
ncbi:MAG: YfdX family protein [Candidatus Thiodiazotropha sp.]